MDFYGDEEDEVGIDLTPLIDVVFMLLIFFIMTTTFSKPVLEIVLPESEMSEVPTQQNKEILVSVTKEGEIIYKNEAINQDKLAEILKSDNAPLNVYVDKEAPFEGFVKVVDIAKKEREGRFVISTERQD